MSSGFDEARDALESSEGIDASKLTLEDVEERLAALTETDARPVADELRDLARSQHRAKDLVRKALRLLVERGLARLG